MARIPAVSHLFSALLESNTLLVSILSCQVISNVPSAILLSQFTADYPALLLGVNIGGTGTLIASLASLITLKEYLKHQPKGFKRYMLLFTAINTAFSIVQLLVTFLRR
jgi:Na+/H+ antiporter NhaD/arsenite permease-like protein